MSTKNRGHEFIMEKRRILNCEKRKNKNPANPLNACNLIDFLFITLIRLVSVVLLFKCFQAIEFNVFRRTMNYKNGKFIE